MRKLFATLSLPLLFSLSAVSANAEMGVLSGTELRRAVAGKIIYISTPLGVELPIRYRPNGTMTGRGLAKYADLVGEMAKSDQGRWWISGAQLCQRWRNWLDGNTYCFKLRRQGRTVLWQRNDGRTGTARIGG